MATRNDSGTPSTSRSRVSRTKSVATPKETLSTVGVDSTQLMAREAREERRTVIQKTHKYIFSNVSHYLCISNDEVEEFVLDEDISVRRISRFLTKEEAVLVFQYQLSSPLTIEDCGRAYAPRGSITHRLFVTNGDGMAMDGKCVYFLKRNNSHLEDRSISDEIISSSIHVKTGRSLLGAISEHVSLIYYSALQGLKSWAVLKKSVSESNKCTYSEIFVDIENFIQHTQLAERHNFEVVHLRTLDKEKMNIVDSITSVEDCLSAAQSKAVVSLLEEIATLWCQQIEVILNDAGRIRREADDIGPKKELEFWLGRTAQFSYLLQQIRDKRARLVIHTLIICKSPVMTRWRDLDMKVTDQANEARDNTKYLYTLEKYCEPLYRCQPVSMIDKLSGLIGTIRLIYNFSPYYTSTDKVSSIFVKITNQIVTSCKNYVSDNGMTRLWDIPKNELYTRLKHCINLFEAYINIYKVTKKKIANAHTERPFNFSDMYIFGKIYTFRTRIDKIICLLDHCSLFSSLDTCTIEGIEMLAARFNSLYINLKKKGYDLLNYKNTAFEEDFEKFQELIDDLKIQLRKFMSTTMMNLKQSSYKLEMMKRFDKLNLDFLDIEKGYKDIISIYNEELDTLQQIYERDKEDPPIQWNFPPISGRIYWLRQMFAHLGKPIFTLQNLRPSVMKTPEGKKATYRYNKFAYVLAKCEIIFHIAWFRSVDAAHSCLQVPILARDPTTRDLIINFDPYVLEVIKEAHYMVKLGLQVPRQIIELIHSCQNVTTTYRKVQMMLQEYASLKDSIPDMFMPLMQPSLFKIDSLIFPALTTITWTSLETGNYFKELDKAFEDFSLLIKTVSDIKYMRIDAKLAQIADTLLCSLPTHQPWTMDEFLLNTKENTLHIGDELNTLNKMICDTVYELLRTFVNSAVNEYKTLEHMYVDEQKIGDPECK